MRDFPRTRFFGSNLRDTRVTRTTFFLYFQHTSELPRAPFFFETVCRSLPTHQRLSSGNLIFTRGVTPAQSIPLEVRGSSGKVEEFDEGGALIEIVWGMRVS